jgi:hypothetical protein
MGGSFSSLFHNETLSIKRLPQAFFKKSPKKDASSLTLSRETFSENHIETITLEKQRLASSLL